MLLQKKGHYVQAINYPTVPVGEEKLRLAPTPHHTVSMINTLVQDMVDIWHEKNLPLRGMECPPVGYVANNTRVCTCRVPMRQFFTENYLIAIFLAFYFVRRNVHFARNLCYSTGANRGYKTSTRRWITVCHFVAHYRIVPR